MSGRTVDAAAGPDFVPVAEEPSHVELFANDRCRVYEVRLPPGHVTRDHLHHTDTVYVVVRGGTIRSDNLLGTSSPTRPGASAGRLRPAGWLARRLLVGWIRMPAGTVLWQPHREHPVIHRVRVSARNREPVRMLGVELRGSEPAPRLCSQPGVRLESTSEGSATYRLDAAGAVLVPGSGVLTVIRGEAVLSGAARLSLGDTVWIDRPGQLRVEAGAVAVLTLLGR